MTKKAKRYLPVIFLLLSGLTFFGFIDGKFRGWDDTNRYLVEAQAWSEGSRPPIKEIQSDELTDSGPKHIPPLLPYSWSFFIKSGDQNGSFFRIRVLQALMMFLSFIGLAIALVDKKRITFGALGVVILIFFNTFCRELVSIPISEAASVLLLILSYLWPNFSGVGVVLEGGIRPPVTLLFGPLLWKNRKSKLVILSALVTLFWELFFFRSLIIPTGFHGNGFSFSKSIMILKSLVADSAFQLFNFLLPYKTVSFQIVWAAFIFLSFAYLIKKTTRHKVVWIFILSYLTVIFLPGAQGVRYFFPLIILFCLEFKPRFPKSIFLSLIMTVFLIHLADRQVESIADFWRASFPETESPGLLDGREWVKSHLQHGEKIMMVRTWYCVNFFSTSCEGVQFQIRDLPRVAREHHIRFIVFPELLWQTGDIDFERKIKDYLLENKYPLRDMLHRFDTITVLDLSIFAGQ